MRTDRLGWVSAFLLMVALYVITGIAKQRDVVADLRQARIDSLAVVNDSLSRVAVRADTVLVHVTDTLRVTIERTRVVQAEAADSVRAHVDSIGAAHLDSLLTAHAEEVEALERLADANLVWGNTWKDYAASLEAERDELLINYNLAQGIIRSEQRKGRFNQVVAVGGAGKVCYDAIDRGQTGLAVGSCGVAALIAIAGG